MLRLVTLLLFALAANCGTAAPMVTYTDASPDSAADAPADAAADARDPCLSTLRLDCDRNGSCETPVSEANCGACGVACSAGQVCSTLSFRCL